MRKTLRRREGRLLRGACRGEGRRRSPAASRTRGIGNGVSEWGKCRLVVESDGTVSLYNGYTEMGQGLLTVLVQFAVEVTGLPASVFHPKVDSTFALGCGQTTGSRATLFGGRAVTSASRKLRADLDAGRTLADLVGCVYAADEVIDDTTAPRRRHREDQDAHVLRLRDPGRRPRRGGTPRARRGRPRRGPRGEPRALPGPDRGLDPHGTRLRAHRGAALRGRHAGHVEPARARRPARPRHADDRGHPRRGARAGRARSARRASARSASCPPRRPWPAPSRPSTACVA